MTRFQNRNVSSGDLPVSPEAIWGVLTDPGLLAELTPLVKAITADGDRWCWQLAGISALGASVAPSFTERMTFTPHERIVFAHDPPPGSNEKAGVEGEYTITSLPAGGTHLAIDLTMWVDLPLPKLSRRAVERIMAESMQRTGDRFAANLYAHLGIDPATVEPQTTNA
ncbi:MAG TPA: SRPBCC family protein [Iamia sp.]|jgi:carbon monoxide dehydrogenase subunit G|nr:SRPBCC family protein [Iamia sp.]